MRERMITELVKELLGPRYGMMEVMTSRPLNEYITGVLSPKFEVTDERDPDIDNEMTGEPAEQASSEDEFSDTDVSVPPLLSPILDPQAKPHSIGISFVIKSLSELPQIRICATWARYRAAEAAEWEGPWQRHPRYFVSETLTIRPERCTPILIKGDGAVTTDPNEAEISIYIIAKQIESDTFHTSVYIVNEMSAGDDKKNVEHHIFQPQIRVICVNNTQIVPYGARPHSEEEREIEFLYRKRGILAKGHLCSAVWKKIDPEQPPAQDSPCIDIPFFWQDGDQLSENDRISFSPPDVRTEFVPVYSVEASEVDWDERFGQAPELDPEVLAETWQENQILERLQAFADGYEIWIADLRVQARELPTNNQDIATRMIERCTLILERINLGIKLLMTDSEARLSFCFANKVISTQAQWSGIENFRWRPFQLAFILTSLESIANPASTDRDVCDLMWIPTGAGKTEAYLALAAFIMAYRRRRAMARNEGDTTGGGVSVITRYTLRLLSIQQFRRALRMVTACEYLRVMGLSSGGQVGWLPTESPIEGDFVWGATRFSIGLWVGGGVTPNRMSSTWIREERRQLNGAIQILQGENGEGEPAQILDCPVCESILAVPKMGLPPGNHTIHLVMKLESETITSLRSELPGLSNLSSDKVEITGARVYAHTGHYYATISVDLSSETLLKSSDIDGVWSRIREYLQSRQIDLILMASRASRPGYFIQYFSNNQNNQTPHNFEIFCSNPDCPLNIETLWAEGVPNEHPQTISYVDFHNRTIQLPSEFQFKRCYEPFCGGPVTRFFSTRIPIPALTIDEQVYHYPPSMIVATVDKFARMPFEPRCSAIFGNVEFYHAHFGYYRQNATHSVANTGTSGHPPGAGRTALHIEVPGFAPPDLIIQDELHLIDGPLGSMVGIYETAVDFLCSFDGQPIKYIASTATVRRASEQIGSVFARRLLSFPPPGLEADERFFLRFSESHTLAETRPGRLYVGVCAPGWGPLTPTIRIWSRLLQTSQELARIFGGEADPFWTLTGYFNAKRELAGARALYIQDIPGRLSHMGYVTGASMRQLPMDGGIELSSNTNSTDLPSILDMLSRRFSGNTDYPETPDALFTTCMFGTGVDVPRLGLMVVHGQPKTTSSYIQATGRVGRRRGAIVVVLYKATRPRDLSHYEMFDGYHRALDSFVEPVTVAPFSRGAMDRAAGPVSVGILRNMIGADVDWYTKNSAILMAQNRNLPEVVRQAEILESRAQQQPRERQPHPDWVRNFTDSELDRWEQIAQQNDSLKYVEYSNPENPVVLGDPRHQHGERPVVYENAPQSLRDIEETTSFET